MKCRFCATPLELVFADLGSAPPSNAYLDSAALHAPERWYPLRVLVCRACWLVQTEDFAQAHELFDAEYGYFSGVSASWRAHCEAYAQRMIERFALDADSHVVEVAANDGTLLRNFQDRSIPCLGVEPTASTAAAARALGIDIEQEFFGTALAGRLVAQGRSADLTAANNVLAHVPDINDFVSGFARLLKPQGVATFEFPHVQSQVAGNQFDTIYHEHFSYLSLSSVKRIFDANGLTVFDVEALPTHGGSLRVYAQRSDTGSRAIEAAVAERLAGERAAGLEHEAFYASFQSAAEKVKNDFLEFLLAARRRGETVAAYGAAAKGNTLLNFAGVRADLLAFVVDRSPGKQGKFLPGSRIPIVAEDRLEQIRPHYIVILPWNLDAEVRTQLAYCREWGARFVTAVPELRVD